MSNNRTHARVDVASINKWGFIMSRKNARANVETNVETIVDNNVIDNNDIDESIAQTNDASIDINVIDESIIDHNTNVEHVATSNQSTSNVVTLKHVIDTNKLKYDPKLIRRVLRKYYASQNNHQKRDAWTFNVNDIENVVKLIHSHCRANKSSNA